MQHAVPQLADMIRNVVGTIDEDARLKKHPLGKHRTPGKEQLSTRALVRTNSSRTPMEKKRSLKRHVSEELLDRTNVAYRSSTKDSTLDMGWAQRRANAKIAANPESQEPCAGPTITEAKRGVALEFDDLLTDDHPLCEHPAQLKAKSSKRSVVSARRPHRRPDSRADSVIMPPPPNPLPLKRRVSEAKDISGALMLLPQAPILHAAPVRTGGATRLSVLASSQPPSRPPPPVLGMRRTKTYNGTPPTASQNPYSKQCGFKVPFVRPPTSGSQPSCTPTASACDPIGKMIFEVQCGSATQFSHSTPSPVRQGRSRPPVKEEPRSSSPSLSPPPEADSSYGEISFDMDAVEETMRQYDMV